MKRSHSTADSRNHLIAPVEHSAFTELEKLVEKKSKEGRRISKMLVKSINSNMQEIREEEELEYENNIPNKSRPSNAEYEILGIEDGFR